MTFRSTFWVQVASLSLTHTIARAHTYSISLISCYKIISQTQTQSQVTYNPDLGDVQEYFLGSGGLINLYGSLAGESLPGVTDAVAQVRKLLHVQ